MRLTADCPRVPGSVYILTLEGVGGWEEEALHKIRDRLSRKEYQSPVAVIEDLREEMARLEQEEGVVIPKTPQLPLRRKKDNL